MVIFYLQLYTLIFWNTYNISSANQWRTFVKDLVWKIDGHTMGWVDCPTNKRVAVLNRVVGGGRCSREAVLSFAAHQSVRFSIAPSWLSCNQAWKSVYGRVRENHSHSAQERRKDTREGESTAITG